MKLVRQHVIVGVVSILVVLVGVLVAPTILHHDTIALDTITTRIKEIVEEKPSEVQLLFVGDLMFDRYIRQTIRTKGPAHLFGCIEDLFMRVDSVVGNLEGPITAHASVSEGSIVGSPANFQFTFPTSTAQMLAMYNIDIVNIGNNHGRDFGMDGVASTRRALSDAGVSFFGGFEGDSPVYQTTIHGIPLSFVNYNQFGGDTPETVASAIATEDEAHRFVVVYTHWGEEYQPATPRQKKLAKQFVDAGADLIIGSHPHVVQEHEYINGVPVYYSLGNTIFDQFWNTDVSNGLAVLATIHKNRTVEITEYPTQMRIDGSVCPRTDVAQ